MSFDQFVGREIFLQCLGTDLNPNYVYLNGGTKNGSVDLASSTDYTTYSGASWKPEKLADGSYAFQCLGSIQNPDHVYLNGNTGNGSVNLAPNTSSSYSGTHWQPNSLNPNNQFLYDLQCLGTTKNPDYVYLNGNTSNGSVNLAPNTGTSYSGTHWQVGVIGLTANEVKEIIKTALKTIYPNSDFPDNNLLTCESTYQTLILSQAQTIWKQSGLSGYTYTVDKFDCDDFAACYKAQASKWLYPQAQYTPKGAAFGTVWAKPNQNGTSNHVFNCFITPQEELIMIDPQTGQQMALNAYKPGLIVI